MQCTRTRLLRQYAISMAVHFRFWRERFPQLAVTKRYIADSAVTLCS
jgi:hypothetical protein